jgi:hypothetical protein
MMAGAIFGLLGVIIGGLLTGAVSFIFERRRERIQARADARLILINYKVFSLYIDEALNGDAWPSILPNIEWSYNIWLSARPNLAATLSRDDWDAIEAGMHLIEDAIETHKERVGQPIDPRDKVLLPAQADTARQATEVLTRLAGRRKPGVR